MCLYGSQFHYKVYTYLVVVYLADAVKQVTFCRVTSVERSYSCTLLLILCYQIEENMFDTLFFSLFHFDDFLPY